MSQRARTAGSFKKGDPRAGRPKGVPNKATIEAKRVAAGLVGDPEYLKRLRADLIAGELAPAVEAMLWYYAYGKPAERLEHAVPPGGGVLMVPAAVSPDTWSVAAQAQQVAARSTSE